jgi:hypothetical protein
VERTWSFHKFIDRKHGQEGSGKGTQEGGWFYFVLIVKVISTGQ